MQHLYIGGDALLAFSYLLFMHLDYHSLSS